MEKRNPYKKGGMFEGALHTVFANAKELRNKMTDAETVLWMHLKAGINDCRFRRQHPIGMYIADFYCYKSKLIIDVDGSIHNLEDVRKNDEEKETFLANAGYSILRFTNHQVMKNITEMLNKITTVVNINIQKQSPNIGG